MKGFSDANVNKSPYNPNADSWVSKTFQKCIDSGYPIKGRVPRLLPSSFPTCSVLNWMKKYRGESVGYTDTKKFSMEYYTGVGNTVHEISQLFMGLTGVQYGHWKCMNPNCSKGKKALNVCTPDGRVIKEGKYTRTFTTKNTCPKCKQPMFYCEVKVQYGENERRLSGYIDGIWKLPKSMGGGYWIVDYKTTSMKKLERGEYPEKKHLWQLPAYCRILEDKYGMDIKGFSLIYVPRDNPRNFYEHAETWNDRWRTLSAERIKEEQDRFTALEKDLKKGEFKRCIKTKPCSTENEYYLKMHTFDECPMLDVCFSQRELKRKLEHWRGMVDNGKLSDCDFDTAIEIFQTSNRKGLGLRTSTAKSKDKPKRITHKTI
tara:strand:+ start:893 stop:2014 length:1122 start_codon:yes stop_codon:yes gene_type:complete